MNTNKKNSIRIRHAKRTLLGKILCRLVGEENGAVMMEYVVVAVLIAAAVAAAAWYFGRDTGNMFGVAGRAATGNIAGARAAQNAAEGDAQTGHANAAAQGRAFIKTEAGDAAETGAAESAGGGASN